MTGKQPFPLGEIVGVCLVAGAASVVALVVTTYQGITRAIENMIGDST